MRTPALPIKDDSRAHPIPDSWRPIFAQIVRALIRKDYHFQESAQIVESISEESASQIQGYIAEYGVILTELPEETWESSCAQWMGSHWDVLVDLWSVEEGRSDLVLGAAVTESESGFRFRVGLVYVP